MAKSTRALESMDSSAETQGMLPSGSAWANGIDPDERDLLTLAAIVQSSDDAIVSKDLDGTIMSWNPGATKLFGWQPEEIIGKSIKTIIPPERHAEEDDVLARIRRGERIDHFETVRLRKDGTPLHISLTVSPIVNRFGVVVGASKIARDITERVEAEEALRQSTAVKDEFLSLVSHELRTPIAVILGNSHILKKRGRELAEGDRDVAIADIAFEAERLQRIIENLLLLTRVEGGEELEIEFVHLERIARQAMDTCRRRSPFRAITFTAVGEVPPALGEATLTALVFENLIGNADKYSPDDEPIEMRLGMNESGQAEVHILDRGIGLSPGDADEVFAPFYRATAAKQHSSGMGLGLAVCKRAVERQGGTIGATARPGGGTDFWFTLPVVAGDEYS